MHLNPNKLVLVKRPMGVEHVGQRCYLGTHVFRTAVMNLFD